MSTPIEVNAVLRVGSEHTVLLDVSCRSEGVRHLGILNRPVLIGEAVTDDQGPATFLRDLLRGDVTAASPWNPISLRTVGVASLMRWGLLVADLVFPARAEGEASGVRDLVAAYLRAAREGDRELRLSVTPCDPELHAVPYEAVAWPGTGPDPDVHLLNVAGTSWDGLRVSVVRRVASQTITVPPVPALRTGCLDVTVMTAPKVGGSFADLESLDDHVARLADIVEQVGADQGWASPRRARCVGLSANGLGDTALAKRRSTPDVFIFEGHGAIPGFDWPTSWATEEPALVLPSGGGGADTAPEPFGPAAFVDLFRPSAGADTLEDGGRRPPVTVLAACYSGAAPVFDEQPTLGFAPQLVAGGCPAVVGMAGAVRPSEMGSFLERLLAEYLTTRDIVGSVGTAVREASRSTQWWWLPVVYTRPSSQRIDDPPRAARPEPGAVAEQPAWYRAGHLVYGRNGPTGDTVRVPLGVTVADRRVRATVATGGFVATTGSWTAGADEAARDLVGSLLEEVGLNRVGLELELVGKAPGVGLAPLAGVAAEVVAAVRAACDVIGLSFGHLVPFVGTGPLLGQSTTPLAVFDRLAKLVDEGLGCWGREVQAVESGSGRVLRRYDVDLPGRVVVWPTLPPNGDLAAAAGGNDIAGSLDALDGLTATDETVDLDAVRAVTAVTQMTSTGGYRTKLETKLPGDRPWLLVPNMAVMVAEADRVDAFDSLEDPHRRTLNRKRGKLFAIGER